MAAEFGVMMLIYLDHAIDEAPALNQFHTEQDLIEAIEEGAVLRVRPKAMTVAVIIAGLLPIMFGGGTGSEVMRRIAAPMVGGMITAPMLSMLVLPAAYLLLHRRKLQKPADRGEHRAPWSIFNAPMILQFAVDPLKNSQCSLQPSRPPALRASGVRVFPGQSHVAYDRDRGLFGGISVGADQNPHCHQRTSSKR